ncbi:hypothetical protein E4M02_01010 [Brevundimonas sp. S30B]|jgi:hypothetical protein|uniref:hypothetical protein n=1 Tax=unclassified Brevundimonas TaxID=2622653 RepID=UPI00107187AE|nr:MULTISPECIES: hypothetical protein [unclassified Brevundimonas]QBX37504.1 hypothetical protein E4M01_06810 [Brevundimonas sp. MF30-B]TFW03703.1 hypothetical protein E4M02_01010 [Brevundimonas sp. S30B]
MADATTAAKARIDRALGALERKINALKARPVPGAAVSDDDLFAPKDVTDAVAAHRIAELEAAGRQAADALARAAEAVRDVLEEDDQEARA